MSCDGILAGLEYGLTKKFNMRKFSIFFRQKFCLKILIENVFVQEFLDTNLKNFVIVCYRKKNE